MRTDVCAMLVALAMGTGLAAVEARADVFMKQQHHSEGFQMMGQAQPPRDFVQKMWMTADKARSDTESHSVIVRLDKGITYFLDHTRKAYTEMSMDPAKAGRSRSDGRSSPEERDAMNRMTQSMLRMSIKITDSGETRKIGEYRCRKYIQKIESMMGPVTSEVWATEDLKMDTDLYARFSLALMASQPGGREAMDANLAETRKMRGVPVLSLTTTRMGETRVKSRVELLEFREEQAPEAVFEIPAGYSRLSMMGPGADTGAGDTRPPRRK